MKMKIYLLPLFLLLAVACTNNAIDIASMEKRVKSMEDEAYSLGPVMDNVTIINDNVPQTEQRVKDALDNEQLIETTKKLKDDYKLFRETVDTKNIRTIQAQAEADKGVYIANKPTHEALDNRVNFLEPRTNEHIDIEDNNGERTIIFKDVEDNLKHATTFDSNGVRKSTTTYDGDKLLETKVYSPNGVNVIKSTKYNDAGKRESVIEYNEDGSKKSQIFFKDGEPVGNIQFSSLDFNTLMRGYATWKDIGNYDKQHSFYVSTSLACDYGVYPPKCGQIVATYNERYIPYGSNPTPINIDQLGSGCKDVYEISEVLNRTGAFFLYSEYSDECQSKCWMVYDPKFSKDIGDVEDTNDFFPKIQEHRCSEESENRFKDFLKQRNIIVKEE